MTLDEADQIVEGIEGKKVFYIASYGDYVVDDRFSLDELEAIVMTWRADLEEKSDSQP